MQIEYKKINLFDMESLPKESELRFPMTWLLKSMNKKWEKSEKIFNFNDYDQFVCLSEKSFNGGRRSYNCRQK